MADEQKIPATQTPATPGDTLADTTPETETTPFEALPQEAEEDPPAQKPRKKIWFARHKLLTVLLAVVLVAVGSRVWQQLRGDTAPVSAAYQYIRTTTLRKTTLDQSTTVTGTVASGDEASVTVSDSAKTYKVATVNVAVGDVVKEGDVIATLDTSDLLTQIENAQRSYNDTLASAKTSYDRAVEDYNIAVTQHENNLIDLANSITEADENRQKAQETLDKAQSSYDAAAAGCNALNAAVNTARSEVSNFQSAYDIALTNLNNAQTAVNNAISDFEYVYGAVLSEYTQNGALSDTSKNELITRANAQLQAFYAFNGNDAGKTTNTCDLASLTNRLAAVGVDGSALITSGTSYDASAAGICAAAEKNLQEAKNSVSNTALGYVGLTAMETALTQAQTTLTSAQNTLDQAKTALETADKQVTTAHQNYDNEKNGTTITSRARSVEDAKTKLAEAQRTPDSLTTLQDTLANCTLTATMSGTITALNATVGSACSGTVATIQDVQGLTVQVTIPANSVADVAIGMQCKITSDATGDAEIGGTLTQINPVANEQGNFVATVRVAGADSGLLIGIQAQVEIIQSQTENVFTVPIDAVGTAEDGSSFVYRQTGGSGVDMTFEEVAVTTGATNDYYVEISGDKLAEGDVIRSSADLTQGIESSAGTQDPMMMGGGMSGEVTIEAAPAVGGGGAVYGGAPGGM